jgi:hypothetical protein
MDKHMMIVMSKSPSLETSVYRYLPLIPEHHRSELPPKFNTFGYSPNESRKHI